MTPEEKARRDIDRRLDQCGWLVQDRSEVNISAGPGVAIREFPMITGEADYFLYAGGKAIGGVETKPQGHTLAGVESQSVQYAAALPTGVPTHRLPLPFCYESTGAVTQVMNLLETDVLAQEIADDLLAAMEQFAAIANELKE